MNENDLTTEDMARLHWEEAVAACRKLQALSAQAPKNEYLIRRASGEFWGAVAVVFTFGENMNGLFAIGRPSAAIAYGRLIELIHEVCEFVDPLPVYVRDADATIWPRFFELVALLKNEADTSPAGNPHDNPRFDELCHELAEATGPTKYSPLWWGTRALHYSQIEGLPDGARI